MWHGVTDDTLGRAFALLGRPDAAEQRLAAALATYDRIGATWWRDRLRRRQPLARKEAPATAHLQPQPGGLWRIGSGPSTVLVPSLRGLRHLHVLLSNPDTDISSLDLVADAGRAVHQPGIEVLDEVARRAYRRRVAELDRELEVSDRVDLRQERDALCAELGGATGLGGRARRTGGSDERARVAVRKAVINALARIAEHDPGLARHLHDRVHTGHWCRYAPDPEHPLTWVL